MPLVSGIRLQDEAARTKATETSQKALSSKLRIVSEDFLPLVRAKLWTISPQGTIFPAHWTDVLAVSAVVAGRGGLPVALASFGFHYTDLAAPAWTAGGVVDPTTAAGLCGGAAALVIGLMPPREDELEGQYFQRIREIPVHTANPSIQKREHFDPVSGYGLLEAGRAVGPELKIYLEHRPQIEEDFQSRMKERAIVIYTFCLLRLSFVNICLLSRAKSQPDQDLR